MAFRKHIFVWFLFSLLLLPCIAPAQDQRGLEISKANTWGKYHALIIGINAYKEWPRLQTAVNDATALKKILVEQYGFKAKDVVLRTEQDANRLGLIRDMRSIASNLGEKDNFLIYFAGHGQLDDLTGDGYWVPVEGKLKDPGTWISHSTVKNILSSERVKGKNILVIADSCYSGSLLRGGPDLLSLADKRYQQKLMDLSALRSRQVITSGGLEPVADGGRDGHSLFAYYLLKALEKNDCDLIDIENLIHSRVWKPVAEIGGQRPSLGRLKSPMDEDGQFVLVSTKPRGTEMAEKMQAPVTASAKQARSADERYEILFWESIKDSNNVNMYKDYLKKFPNGTFAELARINIENLSMAGTQNTAGVKAKNSETAVVPKKSKPGKKPELQASVSAAPAKVEPPAPVKTKALSSSYQVRLAVFPWKLTGSAPRWNFLAIGALKAVLSSNKTVVPVYSYYDLEIWPKPKPLNQGVLGEDLVKKIWAGTGAGAVNGIDIDLVSKLGRQLGVDAVFLSDIYAKPWDPDRGNYKIFLIDTRSGKTYQARSSVNDIEGQGESSFRDISEEIFSNYVQTSPGAVTTFQAESEAGKPAAQASLTPIVSTPKVQKPDSRIKLVIFPWRLTGTASRWNFLAISGLTAALHSNENAIVTSYSYYQIKTRPEPETLRHDYFSQDVLDRLWYGQDGSVSKVPNVGMVCKLAKQLGADAVLVSDNYAKPWDPDPGTYKVYLIDVKTAKMYQAQSATQDIEGQGERKFEQLAEKVLGQYLTNHR